ncbi:MAG TPA: serine hydrolase domain-containing protein, partial [Polyangiaceae bacterium]
AGLDTVFDLASVTKPFLAVAFARLCEQGALPRSATLGSLLEEVRGTTAEHTPLELALSHRAGLSAHLPLFAPLVHRRPFLREAALRAAAHSPALSLGSAIPKNGFDPVYSDMGYLLAGAALERFAGVALDTLIRSTVAEPLGIAAGSARQWLGGTTDFPKRVAPTEWVLFRGGQVSGAVHDENAWAFGGHGLCGHAGLFGTVRDVLEFGMALLDARAGRAERWLTAETIRWMIAERPGGSLRLGFDGKSGPDSSAGPSASSQTFGHLGFTGTSLWCDPDADVVTVLLTNRVCPTRNHVAIRKARPRVHDALFQAARPPSPW